MTEIKALELSDVQRKSATSLMFNKDWFEHAQRVSKVYVESGICPPAWNTIPRIMIALALSDALNIDVFRLMQGAYIVHNKLGLESKLLIALFNHAGVASRIEYTATGTVKEGTLTGYAKCTDESGQELTHKLTWSQVKSSGWLDKKDSYWHKDPLLMMEWRTKSRLIRIHFPEIMFGLYTKEELEDMSDVATASSGAISYAPTKKKSLALESPKQDKLTGDPMLTGEPTAEVLEQTPPREAVAAEVPSDEPDAEELEMLRQAEQEDMSLFD